ncbi:MAG: DUF5698 domain-containing protein [Elusimicrobiota bacterium]
MEAVNALFAGPWGPLIIFALRICDVSIATIRMLLMMRSAKMIVPILAFFEILIWIFAIGSAIKNLNSPWHILGYAGGFATGTVVGMWIEEKLAYGYATARFISKKSGAELGAILRERGFGVTELSGRGREGEVAVFVSVVRRKELEDLVAAAQQADPDIFVTVEETRSIARGWLFPRRRK